MRQPREKMGTSLRKKIKRIRNALFLVNDIRRGLARASYAQEGEDLILLSMFKTLRKEFYVDVGAYHPKRFSNTYLLYRRGRSRRRRLDSAVGRARTGLASA
jgi:hypothetical protein